MASALEEARAALRSGDRAAAIRHARQAISANPENSPDNGPARWLLAVALLDTHAYAEAEAVLAEQLRRWPKDSAARIPWLVQRARALGPLGRPKEAVTSIREAAALLGANGLAGDAPTLHMMGLCLAEARHEAEALPYLRRATEGAPGSGVYWYARGEAEQFLGLIDDAERSYDHAATSAGRNWAAHLALARLKRWTPQTNHIPRLEAAVPEIPLHAACQGYALFKEYDDIGDTARAWDWLQKGAAAALAQAVTPRRPGWSSAEERAITDAWKTAFPSERFADTGKPDGTAPRRIFIIGLPRSGTTLVERILSAHSQVQALGELPTFPAAVKTIAGTTGEAVIDAETVLAAGLADPRAIAGFYNRETAWQAEGRPVVTDKLPHNWGYAGLIRLAFPDAAIVHVRRQPMDALFGAYKLYFSARWSFALDDLADHYAHYRETVAHWKTCLGDGLIDISLEALIADPEAQIRALLDACGLPFEDACLSPETTKGAVSSASSIQVRRPINAEGVGAWRRYAEDLEPLRARLEAMGSVDAAGNAVIG